jgi:hypothetical protein
VANIVSLQEVKEHLRYPNPSAPTSDDSNLQRFITAADECIEFECDEILPRLFEETYDGGRTKIFLRHRPVLEVLNIEEGWGWINFELDFVDVNSPAQVNSVYAYSIDNAQTGEITRRSAGNVVLPFVRGDNNIAVTYRAGESVIPGTLILAELELIAHWWQNSQLRGVTMAGANIGYDAVAGSIYSRDTESGNQNLNIGVPYRILEMIKGHRRMPIIA